MKKAGGSPNVIRPSASEPAMQDEEVRRDQGLRDCQADAGRPRVPEPSMSGQNQSARLMRAVSELEEPSLPEDDA